MPVFPPVPNVLQNIAHFVVLMFENRSFDHLLGYEALNDPAIEGLAAARANQQDPSNPHSVSVPVSRATAYAMPFDPPHEFDDVTLQLHAPGAAGAPVTMGGFVFSAMQTAGSFADAVRVMEAFQADQLPVLTTLAREFAVLDHWHASVPGPTWPNRFFVHAATSGGLIDSPSTAQILAGFSFKNGTIYDRLSAAGKRWRFYHDGLPQAVGIDSLRRYYVRLFPTEFRDMDDFAADLATGDLPDYTFIEPRYDTGNMYQSGNSMHPMNDLRNGEALLKSVYEAVRSSPLWPSVMLIVTFDEHGGFYDHVPPPGAVATGDDAAYNRASGGFGFTQLGVRVPSLVVSAYTRRGTVVDGGASGFDHTSVLNTVETRFGLAPLTARDAAAATLEAALNLANPRADALVTLPSPASDDAAQAGGTSPAPPPIPSGAPLSDNQQSLVDLALKCNLDLANPNLHSALLAEHAQVRTQGTAAEYLARHDDLVAAHRD